MKLDLKSSQYITNIPWHSRHITAFLCVVLFSLYSLQANADEKTVLRLATGNIEGVYYPVGQGIAAATADKNFRIEVMNSEGSVQNLEWLSQGKAELILAQSDIAYNAYNGLGRFKEKNTNIQAIASLYTEAVHILVRNPLSLRNIEGFKGKRISVGPEGGGTESNAIALLETAGITVNDVNLLHLDLQDSISAMQEGKVDILFLTSGYPSKAVKTITQNKLATLFEPNPDINTRLVENFPFFVITTIPVGTYAYQDEEITTIGVPTLLLGRSGLDDQLVYALAKSIFSNVSTISKLHPKGADIALDSALKGIAVPLQSGADQFYSDKGLHRPYKEFGTYIFVIFILIVMIYAGNKYKQTILHFIKTKDIARVLVVIVAVWLIGSVTLYFAEHKINENYAGFVQSFWSTLINWVNFGQKEPYTATGRATATIMMVLGVGSVATLTGAIASVLIEKRRLKGNNMDWKNHYVIINWNAKGAGLVKQLNDSDLPEKPEIVLLTNRKESPLPFNENYTIHHVSYSDRLTSEHLTIAKVHNARSVIVLAEDNKSDVDTYSKTNIDAANKPSSNFNNKPSADSSDHLAMFTALAIKKICNKEKTIDPVNYKKVHDKYKKVNIVLEIVNPHNVVLADQTAEEWGDDVAVEIISFQTIGQHLLAQAAVTPGVTKVYADLLEFKDKTAEIYGYTIKDDSKLKGRTFNQICQDLSSRRSAKEAVYVIPVGMSAGNNVYVNPSTASPREDNAPPLSGDTQLQAGDTLFVICDKISDMKKVEDHLSA